MSGNGCFPNALFAILHSLLCSLLTYFRYSFVPAEIITLQKLWYKTRSYISLYFIKYLPH